MPPPSPFRIVVFLTALLGCACNRTQETAKPPSPASAASAPMIAGLVVPTQHPEPLREPAPDSVIFRLPDGTPVLQAHADTVQELLRSLSNERTYHLPEGSVPDPGDPYFYTAESFSDSESTGDLSGSRLECKYAIAEALLVSAVLSDNGRSVSRGGLSEDTLLTKWGCPPFRPGRTQYGLYPAGEGRAVWKPVNVRYDIDVRYVGPIQIPGKFQNDIQVRVRPFVGEHPGVLQPLLFASSEKGMPADPIVFLEPVLPGIPEAALDSAGLPVEIEVPIPGISSPWHSRLRVRWSFWWEGADPKPDTLYELDREPRKGRRVRSAVLLAEDEGGVTRRLLEFGRFDPESYWDQDEDGFSRLVLTDLDGNGEPDHLFFSGNRGVELLPGWDRGDPEQGPGPAYWIVNPVHPGGC